MFRDVGFDLHAGEIVCITGLVGAKRTEVLQAIFGCQRFDAGTVELDGRPVAFRSPREAIAAASASFPKTATAKGCC